MDTDSDIIYIGYNLNILITRLIELRTEYHLSQAAFANLLNVPRSTVAAWECGDRIPDVSEIRMLADLYDVSVNYLLGFSEKKM